MSGSRVDRRLEDGPLVTGSGRYVADLVPPEALHCWFVRSPLAHGEVTAVERDEAAALPGVIGIYTADDLGLDDIPSVTGRGAAASGMTRPPLARDRVRYVGEPVAVVVASDAAVAEDAAELVFVEIEELPVVASLEAALDGGSLLFPEVGSNVAASSSLAEGEMPADGDLVSSVAVVESPRLAPVPLEPLTILAAPDGEGVHLWCGHQAPHRLRNQLAARLGISPDLLRVTVPDVGGAFGMKGMFFPEFLVVTALALRLRRPLVWVETRRQEFAGGTHGRGQRHRVTLEGDRAGRVRRARIEIWAETGAYPHNGSQIPMFSRLVATGLYDFPRVEVETTTLVTNRAPTGSYRGAGRPEAALAIERAMDRFARTLGLDPIEVRLRNLIPADRLPYRTATGALYDSGDYAAALHRAVELLDLPAVSAERARNLAEGGPLIGVGVGAFIERTGGAVDSGEYARVEVDSDPPGVIVRTGSTDTGQGHATTWRRVVCDALDLPPDAVRVVAGDTAEVATGVGSFASRSTQAGASAAFRVAGEVLEQARKLAADRLEAAVEDLVYRGGTFGVVGAPGAEITLWQLAADHDLAAEELFVPGAQTFPYGVHGAVVEVDRETGEIRIRKLVTVDDFGRILNPMLVEGQLLGSLMQGLGQALLEEVRYDEWGQILTGSMMDYLIPSAVVELPLVSDRLETPAPSNPLGAKGVAETGCIGAPPAILNAVIDALQPLGTTDLQLPLRPSRVWAAMQDASG